MKVALISAYGFRSQVTLTLDLEISAVMLGYYLQWCASESNGSWWADINRQTMLSLDSCDFSVAGLYSFQLQVYIEFLCKIRVLNV